MVSGTVMKLDFWPKMWSCSIQKFTPTETGNFYVKITVGNFYVKYRKVKRLQRHEVNFNGTYSLQKLLQKFFQYIWKWTVVKIMNFQVLSMFFSISTQLLRKLTISEKRQILSISWIVAVKMWIMLILQLRLCVKGSENQAWIILFHVQIHSSIWLHAMNEWRNKPEGYIQNWLLGDIPIALPTWTNPGLAYHISSYQVI
jgi:hypothetical protein